MTTRLTRWFCRRLRRGTSVSLVIYGESNRLRAGRFESAQQAVEDHQTCSIPICHDGGDLIQGYNQR